MTRLTISHIEKLKSRREKFTCLTAYDATFAALLDKAGIEVILVGDSLGMVIQGRDTTVPVTNVDMVYHTRCVARGNKQALLIADLPYMSYATPEQAFTSAAELMQAGAQMVKLEGGEWLLPTITRLTERGVPVCAHLGLTPQSVDAFGGFRVQGRSEAAALQLLADARAVEAAGARMLVLECIPADLAARISDDLTIPTLGIGAGPGTDGQVLVLHDMLGISGLSARFVRNFMTGQESLDGAIKAYVQAVKDEQFPAPEHCFE